MARYKQKSNYGALLDFDIIIILLVFGSEYISNSNMMNKKIILIKIIEVYFYPMEHRKYQISTIQ